MSRDRNLGLCHARLFQRLQLTDDDVACQLDDPSAQRDSAIQRGGGSHHAVPANHGDLDHLAR